MFLHIRTNVSRGPAFWFLLLTVASGAMLLGPSHGEAAEISRSSGQTIYVSAYSHIYSGDRDQPIFLAVTLSIRNTDPQSPITITSVDYYDTDGQLAQHYLAEPLQLSALASLSYVVKESEKTGGAGAKFLVTWTAEHAVPPPLVEAIMIGTRGQQGISFLSRGQVIREREEKR